MVSRTTDYEKRASAFLLERSPAVAKSNAHLLKSRKLRNVLNRTLKMKGGLRWRNLFRRKKQPNFPMYNLNLPHYTIPQKNTTKRGMYSRFKGFFTRKQKNESPRNSFAEENPLGPSRTPRFPSTLSNVSDPRQSVGSSGSFNIKLPPNQNNGFPAMPNNAETAAMNERYTKIKNIENKLLARLPRLRQVALAKGNSRKANQIQANLNRIRVVATKLYNQGKGPLNYIL